MGHESSRRRPRPQLRRPARARRTLGTAVVALLTVAGAAVVDTPVAGAATGPSRNLVADASLKHGTHAWTVTKGARMSVRRIHGRRMIVIRNVTNHRLTVDLNDRRNTVGRTVAGKTYVASAWVRIARPRVTAAVREGAWRGSVSHSTPRVKSAWLRNSRWHRVTVKYRATRSNDSIDFNVLAWKLPPRVNFYVSHLSLVATGRPTTSVTVPAPSNPPAPPSGSPAPPSGSPAPPAGGKLVFDDEFSGSSVDRSKWNVRNDSWASNEESIVTSRSSNVSVGNGVLTIRAQRERYTAYGTTRDYTSGYLDTIGLSSQKYGRWEMRAKLPTAKGMWPAFWLRGDHSAGEVDILEAIGGLPQMTVQTVFPSTNDGSVKRSHAYNVSDTIGAWHVYGFTWTPTSMSWDIDGVTVFTVTSSDVAWESSAFNDTMNIRLNLQVGGSMPKYFNEEVDTSTPLPADYEIDYVRVYSL